MQEQYTERMPVTPMSIEAGRQRLIEEVGNRCFRCQAPPHDGKVLDVDHIVPVARGGINVYENYQLLCGPCNSWKGVRIIDFRPGKSRTEIYADLPILANDQRVRRDRSSKGVRRSVILPPPPPSGHTRAQALVIRDLRAQLAANDITIEGLRADLDDARERAVRAEAERDAARQAAAELKADLAAERAEVARLRERRPWWRKVLGLPPS
jgi:hypothetical protein